MDKATLEALMGVELTDEQYETFNKQHESELDKARTQASQTAAKNAQKKAQDEAEQLIEAKAQEQAQALLEQLTLTEEEKLEKQRKAIEAERVQLETDKKRTAVSAKLKAAGYKDDSIQELTDLFTVKETVDDCEAAVESFLGNVSETIEKKVGEVKATLTDAGASPGSGSGAKLTLDEGKVLDDVYAHAKDEDFINTRASNLELDAYAIAALENAQATGGNTQ